jgi:hypothetical protein
MTPDLRLALRKMLAGFTLPLTVGPACDYADYVRDSGVTKDGDPNDALLGLDYGPSDAGPELAELMCLAVNELGGLLDTIDERDKLRELCAEAKTYVVSHSVISRLNDASHGYKFELAREVHERVCEEARQLRRELAALKAEHETALGNADALSQELADVQASVRELKRELLHARYPLACDRFDCPECGTEVGVDEDGCCVTCGRDATAVSP